MSRKYVNDKWCVRCGKTDPTPYLSKKLDVIAGEPNTWSNKNVVDIGCGNGRNSTFMRSKGFQVHSYDMAGDVGEELVLGQDSFPLGMDSVDIVLANYILMFLDTWEIAHTLKEVDRVTKFGGYIIVELYGAKDSFYPTKEKITDLQEDVKSFLVNKGWEVIHDVKEKFIMRKI